ncbi:hypothetical protein T459_12984, partial [Capsicum annuum]
MILRKVIGYLGRLKIWRVTYSIDTLGLKKESAIAIDISMDVNVVVIYLAIVIAGVIYSIDTLGLKKESAIAIDMPMVVNVVVIYLAIVIAVIELRATIMDPLLVNPSYASRNFFWSSAPSSSILHCWYSTKKHSSDKSILKTIGSEIQRLEETDEVEEEDDFAFKIKDNPGQQLITLTREYKGETIDIKVYMPEENKNDDDTDTNDETDSDDAERETKIDVVVKVSKKNVQTLEFDLTGFADDDFAIDRLSIKDPNAAKGQYHQCSPYGF